MNQMKHRLIIVWIILFGVLAQVAPTNSYGFDVKEHEWVSNAALMLVIDRLKNETNCIDCADGNQFR